MSIKLLIADDHELVLDGLKTILETQKGISVVGSATNGKALLKLIQDTPEVDIVIVDINMPELDGIEATQHIKELYPEVKVLILSMYERSEFVKKLVSVGADGYILKNSGKKILTKAIKTLYAGKTYFSDEIKDVIMNSYVAKVKSRNMELIDLSDKEKNVVRLIALEKSTVEIADQMFLSKHTIDSHRKNILKKLNVKNAAGIYKYALQTGIIKEF